jgi:hypothetical protein
VVRLRCLQSQAQMGLRRGIGERTVQEFEHGKGTGEFRNVCWTRQEVRLDGALNNVDLKLAISRASLRNHTPRSSLRFLSFWR